MKKFVFAISVFSMFVLFSTSALAAWTISVSRVAGGSEKSIIKIELTGDGTALDQDIWSNIVGASDIAAKTINRKYIYRAKTDPDGSNAPSSTYDLTISDRFETATLSSRSTTATEPVVVSDHTESGGYLSLYGYLQVTCEDIGSGNKTDLYLELVD
jgi:hypothetical protein